MKRGERKYVVLLVLSLALVLFFAGGPGGLTGLHAFERESGSITVTSVPVARERDFRVSVNPVETPGASVDESGRVSGFSSGVLWLAFLFVAVFLAFQGVTRKVPASVVAGPSIDDELKELRRTIARMKRGGD